MIVDNHYWVIGGSTAEVYQSKTNSMVPANAADYVAWSSVNTPSSISDEADLPDALRAHGTSLPEWLLATQPTFIQPSPDAYTSEQLAAYSASARYYRATGGIIVTSLNPTVPFFTDVVSNNSVNSMWDWLNNKGTGNSVNWKMSDGSFMVINTSQMGTLQNAIVLFVQACFTCESTTLAAINAGTITTLAQIDAAYAAVSNVYP